MFAKLPTELLAILILSFLFRALSSSGDLWLDEAWSLFYALQATTPLTSANVIELLRLDNTHPVNSLWMAAIGDGAPTILYRILSVILGTASIFIAWRIGLQRNRASAIILALLFAVLYPFVFHGSEARGYGPMLFAILLMFYHSERWLATGTQRHADWVAYGFALGLVSHLTVMIAGVSTAVWYIVNYISRQEKSTFIGGIKYLFSGFGFNRVPPAICIVFALCSTIPLLFFPIVGGALTRNIAWDALGDMMSLTFAAGVTIDGTIAAFFYFAFGFMLIWHWRNTQNRNYAYFLTAIILLPFIVVISNVLEWPQPRYFLPSFVAFVLLFGMVIGDVVGGSRLAARAGVSLLVAVMALSAVQVSALIRHGRGDPTAALTHMIAHGSITDPIRVGGYHDFQVSLMLNYAAGRIGAQDRFLYVPRQQIGQNEEGAIDWWIDRRVPPLETLVVPQSDPTISVVLDSAFGTEAPAGIPWVLYRAAP